MSTDVKTIRIGTRGSPLALRQTEMVRAELMRAHPKLRLQVIVIKTSGDWQPEDGEKRLQTKGDFAKEIEQALLKREIDIAVHSMKDMESQIPDGLVIHHMLMREDPRDCVLFKEEFRGMKSLEDLPLGSVIGTASVRRQAYLLAMRPDLKVVALRGNVETRIQKVRSGQVDASLLALAGLKRLALEKEADVILEAEDMLPAAGQGAIGIEMREEDDDIAELLDVVSVKKTVLCVAAERAALVVLDGSCHTPIGAYAILSGNMMRLRICVLRLDGSERFEEEARDHIARVEDAERLGKEAAARLLRSLPGGVLQQRIEE